MENSPFFFFFWPINMIMIILNILPTILEQVEKIKRLSHYIHCNHSVQHAGSQTNPSYVDVMVLNRSCPAVSQICSFTFSPFTSIVLNLKSTPIVIPYVPACKWYGKYELISELSLYCPFVLYLVSEAVFPGSSPAFLLCSKSWE